MKFFKKNWTFAAAAILILGIFSLRFVNLTKLPVFADEAIYIRWSQVMKSEETLRFLPLSDGKQPLFMWVMIAPLKILEDPLFSGRIVSVLTGLGTLFGISLLSWLLFKNIRVTLAAAAIYAASSYAFFFDRMALADSMLSMFGVWTFVLFYLAVTKIRLDYAMLAGFSLGAAWLTKSPALFFALLLPTIWIFTDKVKNLKKIIPLTLVTVVIGYGMYNILRLGPNFHQLATRNADYVYPLSHLLEDWVNPFKTFLLMSFEWIWIMGPFTVLILAICGYYLNWKKNWKILIVLTAWFLGPILVQSEFAKVFTARYIFFTIPYLFIIAASSLTASKLNWIRVLAVIIAFFVSQSLVNNYLFLTNPEAAKMHRSERSGYLEEWTAGQGIREVADYLRSEQEKDGKRYVVGTEGFFGTLPDGLQIYFDKNPNILVIGIGLGLDEIPDSLTNSKKAGNRTFMVANNERLHADFEVLGAKIIKKFPKAARPDGTRQELWLIEL
jgi:4-amino-4-deoxy-L-arabinose transferase-like glycosyltransferase